MMVKNNSLSALFRVLVVEEPVGAITTGIDVRFWFLCKRTFKNKTLIKVSDNQKVPNAPNVSIRNKRV